MTELSSASLYLDSGIWVYFVDHPSLHALCERENVNTKEINTAQLTAIVANLAELHEWELDHAPLLGTLTGRHLYYRIAQRAVGDRALLSRALKDLMGGSGYTEKALRTRMREMERAHLIESVNGEEDGRSKYLMPTEKFYESIYLHANQVRLIFEKNSY